MEQTLYESTQECKEKLFEYKPKNLPFEKLKFGLSFFIPFEAMKEPSVRAMISTASTKYDKKFCCFRNNKALAFEISVFPEDDESNESFIIYESSDKAKASIISKKGRICKYPLYELPEGQSFIVSMENTNLKTLRTFCSIWSKKLKKKFICIPHENDGIYEIANIVPKAPTFFQSSSEAQRRTDEFNSSAD